MREEPDVRESYPDINARTWDDWVEGGIAWGIPISHAQYERAGQGEWAIYLTPTIPVPRDWFPPLAGARVLGLASGGGQQMPVLAALGAVCTVFDNSSRQLATERMVAGREGYDIQIVQGDMTKALPFKDGVFDLIVHPVSNCYVEEVYPIWRECFRVLRRGGVLLAGMDNGLVFLFNDNDTLVVENKLPYNPLRDPALLRRSLENNEGVQFSHTLEEQIDGQLRAGFRLTHLREDRDRPGDGRLCEYAPTYLFTRAVKP